MKDILRDVEAWTAEGRRVAIATVIATGGSAPRPIGTKLALDDRGRVAGAVSGGCVDGAVVELAAEVLADGAPRTRAYGIADGRAWEVGLPCGGRIEVDVAVWEPAPGGPQARFAALAAAGARAALVTALDGDRAQTLVLPDGATEGAPLRGAVLAAARDLLWTDASALVADDAGRRFVDVCAPAPHLIVFGAVPVAQALCRAARGAGWRPSVADPRSRFATPERLPDADRIVVAWPAEALAALGGVDPATAVVAVSHDPKIDDAALTLAVRAGAGFVGAMGSRRATADRRARLAAAGLSEAELDRISAPVGLDLGATGDAETALSIMAELVAARHGRAGGWLAATHDTIHPLAGAAVVGVTAAC